MSAIDNILVDCLIVVVAQRLHATRTNLNDVEQTEYKTFTQKMSNSPTIEPNSPSDGIRVRKPGDRSSSIPDSLRQSWGESSTEEPSIMDTVSSYVMNWFGFDSPTNSPSELSLTPTLRVQKPREASQHESLYSIQSFADIDNHREFVEAPSHIHLLGINGVKFNDVGINPMHLSDHPIPPNPILLTHLMAEKVNRIYFMIDNSFEAICPLSNASLINGILIIQWTETG